LALWTFSAWERAVADPIRIGIAGAGRIVASEHAPRFRKIPGVELVAVANQTAESSRRAADALEIPRAYRHWGELIEDDDLDAIVIGTWPYLHAPIAIEALYAGKHLMTEARMTTDVDSATAMVDAALDHPDLVAMVVPASFSVWADRAIGRVLGDGTIGRLQAVRVTWDGGPGTDPGEFWRWQRKYSGNNIMSLGILAEALVRWLGPAEWVTAETQLHAVRKPVPGGGAVPTDVPDHVHALIGFGGEVTASVEMSTVTLRGTGIHAAFVGSEGTLEADFGAGTLGLRRGGATGTLEAVTIAPEEHDEWRAERDFVAAIRGEKQVDLTDFPTARRYMQIVDAVHASNREGSRVVLED
jgi:predicted dehydrogenase